MLSPFPITSTTYTCCGSGQLIELLVSFDPPNIVLIDGATVFELGERSFEYGFVEPGEPLTLHMRCADTSLTLTGELRIGKGETATTALLTAHDGRLQLVIERPSEAIGLVHELRFGCIRATRFTGGSGPFLPGGGWFDDPEQAQPTLVITPKKTCPSGIPKTTDD